MDAPPRPAQFSNDGSHLEVTLGQTLKSGQRASVQVRYKTESPGDGLHFFGPTEAEPDVPNVVWSQGESTSNSHWFPCFDHPNERQTSEMIITTAKGLEVSSNGKLVSRKEDKSAGTVTFHWLQDKPHVAYLMSLIVGEFTIVEDTWRGKPVSYWAHPKFQDDITWSFRNTKRMLDFFSDKIGIEYPWDRYGQICCEGFGGGMENTSATTLGNGALHDKRSALDGDSDGLIAHELAHQWWGDLLTCKDWSHLWLNEGFASYFEALWDEYDQGDEEFRYNMYQKAESAMRGGKERPIVDRAYDSPGSMFDSRSYPKGAWVLHMMRRQLGDDMFWQVLNKYGTAHAYATVETSDLRKAVEGVTGRAFERFFHDWTERPGHPVVKVATKWLEDEKLAQLSVSQTQEADAFFFPLTVEFRFDEATPPVRISREVTGKQQTIYQPLPKKPTMVRVDPDQAVLMELKEDKGKDLWESQLKNDPNVAARIRAAAYYGDAASDGGRRLLGEALMAEPFWGVRAEIAKALAKAGGDIARDALVDCLQTEQHKARAACMEQLGGFHHDQKIVDAVRTFVVKGDPSYRVEAAALRSYGKLGADDAAELLRGALSRESRMEVLRGAALEGLGFLGDAKLVATLLEWTRPGKPRMAMPGAIDALAETAKKTHLDDATMQSLVSGLVEGLDDSSPRIRGAAARALGALPEPGRARSALTALQAVAANDGEDRVRRAAKKTVEAIEADKPAQTQVSDLRKELDETKEKNKSLLERIEKLEALIGKDAASEGKGRDRPAG